MKFQIIRNDCSIGKVDFDFINIPARAITSVIVNMAVMM